MGLDNGIIIKPKTFRGEKFLEKYFSHLKNETFTNEYEFAYWRKCYNIRNKILNSIDKAREGSESRNLTIEDLVQIRGIMIHFLNEQNWNMDGGSIWTWEQQLPNTAKIIRDITEFIEYLEDSEGEVSMRDFRIRFYDSY